MQITDNDPNGTPTLAGCTQQLRMIEKFAPASFRALAAAISKAAADAVPPDNFPLTPDARTVAALRLSAADVQTIGLRDIQSRRHAATVGALDEDQRKVLAAMIPAGDRAKFLASLEGSTP